MSTWSIALMFGLFNWQSPIRGDETVLFFPTAGHFDAQAGEWVLPIHGWIFEEEADGLVRQAVLGLFRRSLGLEKEQEGAVIFVDRARRFLVDNESGKNISVRLGKKTYPLEESGANGHFTGEIRLASTEADALLAAEKNGRWLGYRAVMQKDDDRVFAGRVLLLPPRGLSVVSDIDDTVKISQVTDRRALLNNTFLRPFQPVPGMAALYQGWAGDGASFHFVSSSPWQLHAPLAKFFEAEKFPAAEWHMKQFRWKDSSFFDLFASPLETKPKIIEPLMERYPQRRFILVGDSGEKDPEVYGKLARKHPEQVMRILIRDVTGEDAASERMQSAFADVPREKWQVFKEAEEVRPLRLAGAER